MTDAELIDRLIDEAVRAPDWRSGAVRPGLLPLFDYWGPVLYVTPAGDVVRNDEEGGPLRPADPDERDDVARRLDPVRLALLDLAHGSHADGAHASTAVSLLSTAASSSGRRRGSGKASNTSAKNPATISRSATGVGTPRLSR